MRLRETETTSCDELPWMKNGMLYVPALAVERLQACRP